MSRIIVKNEIRKWDKKRKSLFDVAVGRMAKDIVQIGKIRVPFKSGDLQQSLEWKKEGLLKHKVVADTEYAAYQERGRRRDGSHVVRKYTTPNTGAHYLRDAGEKVKENALNYIKQANQLIKV